MLILWIVWPQKNIYGKQSIIKYSGLSFFLDIYRIPTLLRNKKKAIPFCLKKTDDFPSGRVMSKVYRKTQLSYSPNCYWSQWMVFHLSKDFVKMSELPSSQASPSPWESSPGKREHRCHSWFWSLDRLVQWISALLHHMRCDDECTLWSPIYLLYLLALRRQQTRLLLRKSSQLVLQSVTRKVLINGDFLIELKD